MPNDIQPQLRVEPIGVYAPGVGHRYNFLYTADVFSVICGFNISNMSDNVIIVNILVLDASGNSLMRFAIEIPTGGWVYKDAVLHLGVGNKVVCHSDGVDNVFDIALNVRKFNELV